MTRFSAAGSKMTPETITKVKQKTFAKSNVLSILCVNRMYNQGRKLTTVKHKLYDLAIYAVHP